MADFWVIGFKMVVTEEHPDNPSTYTDMQYVAIDVDSIVSVEKYTKRTKGSDGFGFAMDNGHTYVGNRIKKATEDDVLEFMDTLPSK